MPIGFSNKPVLWRMDGGRKIRTLLRSFRLSFDTNGFLFLNGANAKDFSIEGAVVPGLLLFSKNKAKAQEQQRPLLKTL